MKKKLTRWRTPYIRQISKLSHHTDRFVAAAGNCNHFTRFPAELMGKTLRLKKQLDDYYNDYREWLENSNVKNLERFIDRE